MNIVYKSDDNAEKTELMFSSVNGKEEIELAMQTIALVRNDSLKKTNKILFSVGEMSDQQIEHLKQFLNVRTNDECS